MLDKILDTLIYLLPILPPILIIGMVLKTKKVILSFFTGIIASLILLIDFSKGIRTVWETPWFGLKTFFNTIFDLSGEGYLGFLNGWNVSILYFLFALGILSSLMILSGSTRALSNFASTKIKTAKGSQYLAAILGLVIFIDDYFNALAVGNISKPITSKFRVSRAKLAYLVDSTAAPVCVIAFISSWGAGIISTMNDSILENKDNLSINATTAFFQAIPFQFYVITALVLVFLTIIFNINLGAMRKVEEEFQNTNIDPSEVDSTINSEIDINHQGDIWDIIIPLGSLFLGTILAMVLTDFETDKALRIGGTIAIIGSVIPVIRYQATKSKLFTGVIHGIKSMLRANIILALAWVTASLIGALGTADVLSHFIDVINLNANFLPIIVFLLAAFMAFATGTSWGTFGILIPLAVKTIAVVDPALFVPVVAATLSGAVFGDHASPISDTTLLSSAGSGCDHASHFKTQVPYALTAAIIASLGYLTYGVFNLFTTSLISLFVAYAVIIVSFIVFIIIYKSYDNKKKATQ